MITHPQVPGQCARFLRGELAHARVASRQLDRRGGADGCGGRSSAGAERGRARSGTLLAAGIYGGTVLREGVEDRDDNETRFVWLASAGDGTGHSELTAATAARARGG